MRALSSSSQTDDDDDQLPAGIPSETWALLREAGHGAAQRLADLIADDRGWKRLKPAEQARLIELALTRAYGPPVQRQATLTLEGRVSDDVADSLARLSAVDLPENARSAAVRGSTAPTRSSEGADAGQTDNPPQRRSPRRFRHI